MSRMVHGGRALLNLPGYHSTAAIVAEVDDTGDREIDTTNEDGYALLANTRCKITDCDDSVNIEFDISTANQLENSLFKLDTMIEVLMGMRDGLIIEHHRLQDRLDEYPDKTRLYTLRHAVGKRSTIGVGRDHLWEGSE